MAVCGSSLLELRDRLVITIAALAKIVAAALIGCFGGRRDRFWSCCSGQVQRRGDQPCKPAGQVVQVGFSEVSGIMANLSVGICVNHLGFYGNAIALRAQFEPKSMGCMQKTSRLLRSCN